MLKVLIFRPFQASDTEILILIQSSDVYLSIFTHQRREKWPVCMSERRGNRRKVNSFMPEGPTYQNQINDSAPAKVWKLNGVASFPVKTEDNEEDPNYYYFDFIQSILAVESFCFSKFTRSSRSIPVTFMLWAMHQIITMSKLENCLGSVLMNTSGMITSVFARVKSANMELLDGHICSSKCKYVLTYHFK